MSGQFSIDVVQPLDLVRIRMSGFFTPADVDAFVVARCAAHGQLRCGANAHLTLNDISGLKIQSQDVVAAFQAVLSASDYRSRRLAFVVGPSLARGQLLRAFAGRDARCFETVGEAEAWLLYGDEEQTPLRRAFG